MAAKEMIHVKQKIDKVYILLICLKSSLKSSSIFG